MPLPIQPVTFKLGPVQQAKGRKHLALGELEEAVNVRLVQDDQLRKRPGFDRASPTADTGSFTSNADSLTSDGKRLISIDGDDRAWAENTTANTRVNRGKQERAYPETSTAPLVPSGRRQSTVYAGGYYWTFVVGSGEYRWMIWDPATRTVLRALTTQTAANITRLVAVQDGTRVWVIWLDGTTTVRTHKYVIATPSTAPTSATFTTLGRAASVVDAFRLTATGEIAVTLTAVVEANGTTWDHVRAYLDTSNGQAKSSPAVSTTSNTGIGYDNNHSHVRILRNQTGSGNWYYAVWTNDGVGNDIELHLIEVNVTTLAVASTVILDTVTNASAGTYNMAAWCTGYVAGNGDRVVYGVLDEFTDASAPAKPRTYTLKRYTRSGSTTTVTVRPYSYPVSDPVLLGSAWYLVTGYDDGNDVQRTYFLIDSDGKIVSTAAQGQAVGAGQCNGQLLGTVSDLQGHVTEAFQTQTGRVDVVALMNTGGGAVDDFAPALLSFDTAATYGAPTKQRDGAVVVAAGVPTRVGTADNIREIAPLLAPPTMTFGLGSGAPLGGATLVQAVYILVDSDGTISPSAPNAAQSPTFTDAGTRSVTVPSLTHLLEGTTAYIALYLSEISGTTPYLHKVVANDPTANAVTITVTPSTIVANEILYTFGGGLSAAPPPPARWSANWRRRTFLGGKDVWYSLEHEAGFAPRFNEALRSQWMDGEGETIAGAAIDKNSFAIFKRDRVGAITGPGPDGRGVGAYEIQTIEGAKGLINSRSVASGPDGCYFQSLGDGRIYVVTPGLQIADASAGMESYRAETVTAVVLVESWREMWFFTANRILRLDYAHKTQDQPFGRWMTSSSSNLLQAYGAAIAPDGTPYHIEAAGTLRKPGTTWADAGAGASVAVLKRVKTGDLAAGGALNAGFRLDAVHILGQYLGAHTLKVTVTSDGGEDSENRSKSVSEATVHTLLPRLPDEIASVQLTIEESANANATEGFVFDGITLDVQPYAKTRAPAAQARF